MNEPKYKTCIHSQEVGKVTVLVGPGCPRAALIKGILVSSKQRCEECWSWKEKV